MARWPRSNLAPTLFRPLKSPVHPATTHVQRRRDVLHGASGFKEFHSLIGFEPADDLRRM
jgi:hypothetical protein